MTKHVTKMISICLIALLLLSVVTITISAAAADGNEKRDREGQEDRDEKKDLHPRLKQRKVDLVRNRNNFKLRSRDFENGTLEEFEIHIQKSDFLSVALTIGEFKRGVYSYKGAIRLNFKSIMEFNDTNDDGLFQRDEFVSAYQLNSRRLGDITYKRDLTSLNETLHTFTVESKDGVFGVYFYVTGNLTDVDSGGEMVSIAPSEVKFDIRIDDFPYTRNDTMLALRSDLITRQKLKFRNATTDEELNVTDDESGFEFVGNMTSPLAFFSWDNIARIDGKSRSIHVDIDNGTFDKEVKHINIIYPRGVSIFHDPRLGVHIENLAGNAEPAPAGSGSGGSSAVAAIGIVAAIVALTVILSVALVVKNRRFHHAKAARSPVKLEDYPFYKQR